MTNCGLTQAEIDSLTPEQFVSFILPPPLERRWRQTVVRGTPAWSGMFQHRDEWRVELRVAYKDGTATFVDCKLDDPTCRDQLLRLARTIP